MRDRDYEHERQRRRLALMRMQGDIGRAERRNTMWLTVAAVLGVLALFGALVG